MSCAVRDAMVVDDAVGGVMRASTRALAAVMMSSMDVDGTPKYAARLALYVSALYVTNAWTDEATTAVNETVCTRRASCGSGGGIAGNGDGGGIGPCWRMTTDRAGRCDTTGASQLANRTPSTPVGLNMNPRLGAPDAHDCTALVTSTT